MHYRHRFEIAAPLAEVAAFHRKPASLAALTPRLVRLRLLGEPAEELGPGDEISFRLWAGPVPIVWKAKIEQLEGKSATVDGFQDRQLAGPFAHWVHRHRFVALGERTTAIEDEIEARFALHPLWGPIGWQSWIALPVVFAYRERQTRRLLAGS